MPGSAGLVASRVSVSRVSVSQHLPCSASPWVQSHFHSKTGSTPTMGHEPAPHRLTTALAAEGGTHLGGPAVGEKAGEEAAGQGGESSLEAPGGHRGVGEGAAPRGGVEQVLPGVDHCVPPEVTSGKCGQRSVSQRQRAMRLRAVSSLPAPCPSLGHQPLGP